MSNYYFSTLIKKYEEPQWNSSPAWKLPGWAEPTMVATILLASMFITRKKRFSISRQSDFQYWGLDEDPDPIRYSDDLLTSLSSASSDSFETLIGDSWPLKNSTKSTFCGRFSKLPLNTSRFSQTLQSRILQKFPFLVEMFYWIITYAFYRSTAILSQIVFSKTAIWDVAQANAISVLEFEHSSFLRFLWPVHENEVQQWFMSNHQTFLTVLNRSYALIHIPGTVGFIAWYYYVAPSHALFATFRRTMTLTNLLAFTIFIIFPCMPPRLLPREYGFLDSVGRNNAESVWMSGKYVNSLAAMPSMHFGYAFCIGCTLIYHSGILGGNFQSSEHLRCSKARTIFYILFAMWYPSWILITIVATANHYYLDACVAFIVVLIAFILNKLFLILMPLENLLFWCLRLEKPRPTTGTHRQVKNGLLHSVDKFDA